jgi:sec-independent protein translocase protein TatA
MHIVALGIGNLVGSDVLILALIVTVVFGAKKLPEIARNVGQGLNEFRRARNEIGSEVRSVRSSVSNSARGSPGDDGQL